MAVNTAQRADERHDCALYQGVHIFFAGIAGGLLVSMFLGSDWAILFFGLGSMLVVAGPLLILLSVLFCRTQKALMAQTAALFAFILVFFLLEKLRYGAYVEVLFDVTLSIYALTVAVFVAIAIRNRFLGRPRDL